MTATTARTKQDTKQDSTPDLPDLEVILPPPGTCVLDGMECRVKPLKTREFFAVMGIITTGLGGGALQDVSAASPEELQGEIIGAVLVALPNAIEPFLTLVKDITEPVRKEDSLALRQYLDNPDPEDLLVVIDCVIDNEKDNLWSLLGKSQGVSGEVAEDVQQDGAPSRPWARAFDLILHQYPGYTDESILDLTVARVRQMVDVISERLREQDLRDKEFALIVAELQTKQLGSLLAGLAQSRKASRDISAAAQKINFRSILGRDKKKELPNTRDVMRVFGVGTDGLAGKRG